jgi:regulator of cell morphogenesis and NO signaling
VRSAGYLQLFSRRKHNMEIYATMPTNTLDAPTPIIAEDTLNAIIARYPQTLPVLQHFGLDTCCGGALPLHTAAQHHGLDLAEVVAALRAELEMDAR